MRGYFRQSASSSGMTQSKPGDAQTSSPSRPRRIGAASMFLASSAPHQLLFALAY